MSSTVEVRRRHAFDVERLRAHLADNLAGFQAARGELRVRQFSFGQSNPTFLLTTPTTKYVLRKKPPGRIVATAHAVEREFTVLEALHSAAPRLAGRAVPVPQPLLLCTDTAVVGTAFYVMQFVQGRVFTNPFMPDVSADHRAACYRDAVRVLANLHAINLVAVGLAGFGKNSGYYARQLRRLSKVHAAQCRHTAAIPRFAAMYRWLAAHAPRDSVAIVHGDYKIDNLVFHATEPRVVAVLDWEMSTIGHPVADLANLSAAYYVPGSAKAASPGRAAAMMQGLAGIDLDGTGVPDEPALVRAYSDAAHRTVGEAEWTFCKAFLFFKYSVITQGIAAREAQGSASSGQARQAAAMLPIIAQVAAGTMGIDDDEDAEDAGAAEQPAAGAGGAGAGASPTPLRARL